MTTSPESVRWRKSTASGQEGCVEVAFVEPDAVLVRDSKDPTGPVLSFTTTAWEAFLAGTKAGTFDPET